MVKKIKKRLKTKKRFKVKKEFKSKSKLWLYLSIIFILILTLYTIRKVSSIELDDVHPTIPCDDKLIKESDVLWVIPLSENVSINEFEKWCEDISALNKTLGLHGVYHTHDEFNQKMSDNYVKRGISEFEHCFYYIPKLFKPPQLSISRENRKLVEKNNMIIKAKFNQIFHKVYHCSDSGLIPNKIISLF